MANFTKAADFGLGISTFTQTYSSFSGCDIKAHFGHVLIGNIQGISFSVTREKAPLFVMGSTDPVSFSRGKRGIAGSLIFTIFDRAALADVMDKAAYAAKQTDISSGGRSRGLGANTTVGLELRKPNYLDQIPPFDITLTGANEYGQMMMMRIYGVELLNQGSGLSIDDISNESQVTFVARAIQDWMPKTTDFDAADFGGQAAFDRTAGQFTEDKLEELVGQQLSS